MQKSLDFGTESSKYRKIIFATEPEKGLL